MTANTTTSPSGADDDPAFDIDPDGDAAAYDEWAALAGEPARPPPDHPQRDFADNQASFGAIASSLTKTRQVRISWALYRRGPTEPSPFVDAIPERSRVFLSRLNPKNLSPQARASLRHIAGRLRRHG
jgi:hypothetical protein